MFLDSYISPLNKNKKIPKRFSKEMLSQEQNIVKGNKKFERFVLQAYKAFIEGGQYFNRKIISDRYGLNFEQSEELMTRIKLLKIEQDAKTFKEVEILEKVVETKETDLTDILDRLRKEVDNDRDGNTKQSKIKEGFVYLICNSAWSNWVKVGMTWDYESRLKSYNGYDPECNYSYLKLSHVLDRRKVESNLISLLGSNSLKSNGEWFKIDKDIAIKIFEEEIKNEVCILD